MSLRNKIDEDYKQSIKNNFAGEVDMSLVSKIAKSRLVN